MKPADVARLVHACGDAALAKHSAIKAGGSEVTSVRARVDALEDLLEVVTDILLAGTSADPAASATKSPAAKKARK